MQLEKIHKDFIWSGKKSKVKHTTLINDYSEGGLRDIDIKSKIKALQLSWIRRLYDNSFHPWKVIPNHFFSNKLFYPNFNIDFITFGKAPIFYKNIVNFWCEVADSLPVTASSILSECIFNNNLLKIENNIVKRNFLGMKRLLFVADLFDDEGNTMRWECFKHKNNLKQTCILNGRN